MTKSAKRGIAYELATAEDLQALSPGISWWYNWALKPKASVPTDYQSRYGLDFLPMLWNGSFNDLEVENFLRANPGIKHLLLLNEPNLGGQANLTPQAAAQLWPRYETIAANTGVMLVGPAMTWGNMANYADPVAWLDAFYAAYQAANNNRLPRIDYLVFHWYDYGLKDQLDRLKKYGKSFWVTELANWHVGDGNAEIDSVAKQKAQMTEMVKLCEDRADVYRYAWFTGRMGPEGDPHFTSLLAANGQLTELGQHYLSLPFASTPPLAALCKDMIGDNHGHTMIVTPADLDSTTDKTYDISGTSGHAHTVTLTVANLRAIKAGGTVTVNSVGGGHVHKVDVSCVAT
jgi:hypothetical protein